MRGFGYMLEEFKQGTMAARSLRAHLLRLLLPPIAALLAVGAVVAYYPSLEPATQAYDQALVDIGLAIGSQVRVTENQYRFELPQAVDQVLRTDRFDRIFYRITSPSGIEIAGDPELPPPPSDQIAHNTTYDGRKVRVVTVQSPCGSSICTVLVGETTLKRERLARDILLQSLFPELLIALATLVIVWFGVKRGLEPLARLSEEIKARSGDLRPIDAAGAPQETRPLVGALNGLLEEVSAASRSQQRFLANAAHQLRTPLAGLQAHTELALAQPMPEACRTQLEQVHRATIAPAASRTSCSRSRAPSRRARSATAAVDERYRRRRGRCVAAPVAHRDIDLGFELDPAPVQGDAFLLREALSNLVHNAIEYSNRGGRVTVRTGRRNGHAFLEVEDDGPGIAPEERERVLSASACPARRAPAAASGSRSCARSQRVTLRASLSPTERPAAAELG